MKTSITPDALSTAATPIKTIAAEAPLAAPMSRFAMIALHTGLAVWLYLRLFLFPKTPFLLSGDQVYYSFYGQRMFLGERVYRDFFQFAPPGADLAYLAAFRLFGLRAWVPNLVVLVLGLFLGIIVLTLARCVMSARAAVVATLLTIFLYGYMANGTHHWFSITAVLAGVAILAPKAEARRLAMAGAAFALAAFCTQTTGVAAMAGTVLFLVSAAWRNRQAARRTLQQVFVLVAAFGAISVALNLRFLLEAGTRLMWYCQVTYVTRYFLTTAAEFSWTLGAGVSSSFWRDLPGAAAYLVFYALAPATYAIVLLRGLARRDTGNNVALASPLWLLCCVGFFLLAEATRAPSWVRWFPASVPAILALVALYPRIFSRRAGLALTIVLSLLAMRLSWITQRSHATVAELPAGRVAINSPTKYARLDWLARRTAPGEWLYDTSLDAYFPLLLRSPAYVAEVYPDRITRPEFVSQIVAALEQKHVRYVVWGEYLDLPTPGAEDNLGPLRLYLHNNYLLVRTFDGEQIWQRDTAKDDTASEASNTKSARPASQE